MKEPIKTKVILFAVCLGAPFSILMDYVKRIAIPNPTTPDTVIAIFGSLCICVSCLVISDKILNKK